MSKLWPTLPWHGAATDDNTLTLETALAQRDEARLRINLIALAMNECRVFPVPERHAALVSAVIEALQPVRELLK